MTKEAVPIVPKDNVVPFRKAISYVISVSLETGCYRHIQIASTSTLEQLHEAILSEFGFDDDHLHAFFLSNRAWDSQNCYYSKHADEGLFTNKVTLTEAGLTEGKKFLYIFDFGEEWRFSCRVLHQIERATPTPVCVRSKGDPPEQYSENDGEIWDDDEAAFMEAMGQMRQIWRQYAIKQEKPAELLREVLDSRDKSELVELLKSFGAQKTSRWSKNKLIEALAGYLVKPDVLRERLLRLPMLQWNLCKQAAATPILTMEEAEIELCAAPHAMGLLQPYQQGKRYYCVMPQEIRALFKELLTKGLEAEMQRSLLLDEYAMAACNLYGVIPVQDFIVLFNDQNATHTCLEEVQSVLGRLMAQSEVPYCLWNGHLVHEALWLDDFGAAEEYLVQMGDKPRYIPPKDELLKYANINYYQLTPQLKALANYLIIQYGMLPNRLDGFLEELHMLVFFEHGVGEVLELLADKYGILLDEKQLQQGLTLLSDVFNHTRIWANKGHTPAEMFRLKGDVPFPLLRNTVKVGRNELCPCGSGKKYKHCCGR